MNLYMKNATVTAPARLHLGFVGLFGDSAKEFGALGLAIDTPVVRVKVSRSERWKFSGKVPQKARQHVATLQRELGLDQPMQVVVSETIPSHIGLGSGTQLALAIAAACSAVGRRKVSIEKLSALLGRGKRSGIGTAAFSTGGFLIDRASKTADESRAVSMRFDFPEEWRILLVIDHELQGAHGTTEVNAFRDLGGFSTSLTGQLQEVLLERVVPALQRRDIFAFGQGITKIQNQVGDFFKPIQGGRYLSPNVSKILETAVEIGAAGVGQSSWGPTGFMLAESAKDAQMLRSAILNGDTANGIQIEIVKARNLGAQLTFED